MSTSHQHNRQFKSIWAVLLIGVLALGVAFRLIHLDRKVYWVDEVYTSLRMSGYTETEFVSQVFTGEPLRAGDLQRYQHPSPDKSLHDTLTALSGNAEHAPLYFLLARFWTQTVGASVGNIRLLSALLSLLAFPCLYWLCRLLFAESAVRWTALALFAVSPLHVLYAQEARQYSLWTVMIVLSSAVLLWAVRGKSVSRWVLYGITVAAGLYTHLLFGMVAIAHGLYVAIQDSVFRKPLRFRRNSGSYLLATLGGLLAFLPWLIVVIRGLTQIRTTTAFLTEDYSLGRMVDFWFLNLNRVFIDQEWGAANILLVVLVVYALYFLWQRADRRTGWFILLLVGVPFLLLLVPDLLLGGQRSLRIRYLIPCFLGMQLAIAFMLAPLRSSRWFSRLPLRFAAALRTALLVGLIALSIWGCAMSAQAQVWWNKSSNKSSFFPPVAQIINQAEAPLVLSDGDPINLLAFSYLLEPDVHLRLGTRPQQFNRLDNAEGAFLLTPSNPLRRRLERQNYQLTPIYEEDGTVYLWQISAAQGG